MVPAGGRGKGGKAGDGSSTIEHGVWKFSTKHMIERAEWFLFKLTFIENILFWGQAL